TWIRDLPCCGVAASLFPAESELPAHTFSIQNSRGVPGKRFCPEVYPLQPVIRRQLPCQRLNLLLNLLLFLLERAGWIVCGNNNSVNIFRKPTSQAYHADLSDLRNRFLVNRLEIRGVYILPRSSYDDIFDSACDIDIAVCIHPSLITGMQPPIPDHLLGGSLIAEIFLHQAWRAYDDFAYTVSIGMEETQLHAGYRPTNRSFAASMQWIDC